MNKNERSGPSQPSEGVGALESGLGITDRPSEGPHMKEVSSGVWENDSKPQRVDDARAREIINHRVAEPSEGLEQVAAREIWDVLAEHKMLPEKRNALMQKVWIETLTTILARHFSGGKGAECAARKAGTAGGNAPQDCNWPFCGCDPKANEVLEAIQESGLSLVRLEERKSDNVGVKP